MRVFSLWSNAALIQQQTQQALESQMAHNHDKWTDLKAFKQKESQGLDTAAAKKYGDCATKYAGKGIPDTLEACMIIAKEQDEKAAKRLKGLEQYVGERYRRSNAYNVKGIQETAATGLKEMNQAKQAVEGQHRKFNNAYINLFRRLVGLPPLS